MYFEREKKILLVINKNLKKKHEMFCNSVLSVC